MKRTVVEGKDLKFSVSMEESRAGERYFIKVSVERPDGIVFNEEIEVLVLGKIEPKKPRKKKGLIKA